MLAKSPQMRFSVVSSCSIAAGIAAGLLFFSLMLIVASSWDHGPFAIVPITIFGPFVIGLVVATLAIRERYVFDEAAHRLTIQTIVFFVGVGQPRCVPLAETAALDFGATPDADGFYHGWIRVTLVSGERIEINGQAAEFGAKVPWLVSLVNKARAAAGSSPLPRFSCHAPPEPRRILNWLRSVGR